MAPTEDIEEFYMDLYSRKIHWHKSPDKIRWGYSNLERFNIKEAIVVLNETHRMEKEAKWRKNWGGKWWPKIASFCWIILEC